MFKRITASVLTLIIMLTVFAPNTLAISSSPPSILSDTAVLIDGNTGQVIFDKNMHKIKEPASTTKIVTGYLSTVYADSEDIVTIDKSASYLIPGATHISLLAGEQVTMEDLQYAAMLMSANDACNAIATYISGGNEQFAVLMNDFAKSAGALNTNFTNPHGLPEPEHVTTAYDLAMMAKATLQNSDYVKVFSSPTYTMEANNLQPIRYFANIHEMVLPSNSYHYDGIIGGKTGWTEEARHTAVTVATKGDMTLIAVVMDHGTPSSKYKDTAALFDYGFANFTENIYTPGSFDRITLDVMDGVNNVGSAEIYLTQGATFLLDRTTSMSQITYSHNLPDTIPLDTVEDHSYTLTLHIPSGDNLAAATIDLPLRLDYTPSLSEVITLPMSEQIKWVAREVSKIMVISAMIMTAGAVVLFTLYIITRTIMRLHYYLKKKAQETARRRKKIEEAKIQRQAAEINRKKRLRQERRRRQELTASAATARGTTSARTTNSTRSNSTNTRPSKPAQNRTNPSSNPRPRNNPNLNDPRL